MAQPLSKQNVLAFAIFAVQHVVISSFAPLAASTFRSKKAAYTLQRLPALHAKTVNFDFDSILQEGGGSPAQYRGAANVHRRRASIVLPDSSAAQVVLASAAPAAPPAEYAELAEKESALLDEEEELLKWEEENVDQMLENDREIQQYTSWKERKVGSNYPSVAELWDKQDYLGIMWKWGFPVAVGVAGIAGAARVGAVTYQNKMEDMVKTYANEMIYHDGDFEEMKMCHRDWSRKLGVLSLNKKKLMITKYLELYAKKKPVSPQAVSSLSYVFSIYKFTEQRAADILCEVAESLKDKPASAGKLLFFGNRILKSPEGQAAMQPIFKMLASSYKVSGEMFVTNAQKSMGEAAYRSAVAAKGKGQTSLTPGWEILGLSQETAQTIYDEAVEDNFMTGAQKLYGGKNESKFDAKGRKLDEDNNLVDPSEADKDDDEDTPVGTVFECSECGYTMFPAKGREFKFIPATFKCPECGAAKDKFVDRSKE